MSQVRDTIVVQVEYNTEDVEYGPVYVASCDDLGLVTDGRTFEELLEDLDRGDYEEVITDLEGMLQQG